jgi:hypothetical protein
MSVNDYGNRRIVHVHLHSHVLKTPLRFSLYIRTSLQTYKHIFQTLLYKNIRFIPCYYLLVFALSGDHIALRHDMPRQEDEGYIRDRPL